MLCTCFQASFLWVIVGIKEHKIYSWLGDESERFHQHKDTQLQLKAAFHHKNHAALRLQTDTLWNRFNSCLRQTPQSYSWKSEPRPKNFSYFARNTSIKEHILWADLITYMQLICQSNWSLCSSTAGHASYPHSPTPICVKPEDEKQDYLSVLHSAEKKTRGTSVCLCSVCEELWEVPTV